MVTLKWKTVAACLIAVTVMASPAAWAGRSCEEKPPTVGSIERGLSLAQKTAEALDASGAQVVVLARAGQNLEKYGLQYSQLGFAYREADVNGTSVCTWPSTTIPTRSAFPTG